MKTVTLSLKIVSVLVLVAVSFLPSPTNSLTKQLFPIEQAEASHDAPFEIYAGQTGSVNACIHLTFAGTCKQGVIDAYVPGLSFNQEYVGMSSCSNGGQVAEYTTTQYDATGLTSVTQPTEMSFSMYAWEDTGGECEMLYGTVTAMVYPATPPDPTFTCSVNTPSQTIDPDSTTSYNIATTPLNGFSSAVNFTATITPPTANPPTVSFTNNGQVSAATTVAVISTTSTTSAGTYTINFIGSGGGETASCNAQLVVNLATADFQLTLTPSTGVVTNPNRSNIGSSPVFAVFASCTGGFAGPVTNLAASTTFSGVSLSLGSTTLACGSTTTLTVSNTGSVPAQQQSSMINTILESLIVTGQGQL